MNNDSGSNGTPELMPNLQRIFISIDMDAFYCGVEELHDPSLVDEAFVVTQKNVVCSPSYAARALGIKKLDKVLDVRRNFPDVKMVNGESLAKYRKAGFQLFDWMKHLTGHEPIERLGLEEMKLEITSPIAQIVRHLQTRNIFGQNLGDSQFELAEDLGDDIVLPFYNTEFECPDFLFEFPGKTWPENLNEFVKVPASVAPEFYVAGHLANAIMWKLRTEKGYKCSIGVASTKNLAKIVCSMNKPNGVTVLVGGHEREFMQTRLLKQIPGYGSKLRHSLDEQYGLEPGSTVADMHQKITKEQFLKVGSQQLWDLSFGIENDDIAGYQIPSQVSVEDTFLPFVPVGMVKPHIERLVESLLDQFQTDLVSEGVWRAQPTHFRLAIATGYVSRRSRSQKLIAKSRDNDGVVPTHVRIEALYKALVKLAMSMLPDLAKVEVRLINVALVLEPADGL